MGSYEILPHTADVRLKVRGETLEELFKQAVLGMNQILSAGWQSKVKNQKSKAKIKVKSVDITSLLIDFLNEILAKSQANKSIYSVLSLKIRDSSLESEIYGFPVSYFTEDIKAVTYHEAEIKKNEQGNFETIIIFDI
jgi:SHS2 domain-containing protein